MPVLIRRGRPASSPHLSVQIGPVRDREEFLVPYGAELAPLVTDAHLATQMHHLVVRVGGKPVGCARVRLMGDTAYLGPSPCLRPGRAMESTLR